MPRIVKDYDERKIEFLNATREAFFSVGYEKTSVQMLVDKVGVAKGTFYHYFKSKEDLLYQYVGHQTEQLLAPMEAIAEGKEQNGLEKLNQLFRFGQDWKIENIDLVISLIKVLYADTNLRLLMEMGRTGAEKTKGILGKVIEQGVNEGLFSTGFPLPIAERLLQINQIFGSDLSRMLLHHYETGAHSLQDFRDLIHIWHDVIERILGAPKGSIVFVNDEFLNALFTHTSTEK